MIQNVCAWWWNKGSSTLEPKDNLVYVAHKKKENHVCSNERPRVGSDPQNPDFFLI